MFTRTILFSVEKKVKQVIVKYYATKYESRPWEDFSMRIFI